MNYIYIHFKKSHTVNNFIKITVSQCVVFCVFPTCQSGGWPDDFTKYQILTFLSCKALKQSYAFILGFSSTTNREINDTTEDVG